MFSKMSDRSVVLGILALTALAVYAITRVVLLVTAWNSLDYQLPQILGIAISGVINDLMVLPYLLLPFALYLYLIPRRVYQHPLHRYWLLGVYAFVVFCLLFVVAAELLYWEEFEVRFNFISVDYLVYRREVGGNIWESYPVVPILAFNLCISLVVACWLKRFFLREVESSNTVTNRLGSLAGWFVVVSCNLILVAEPVSADRANRYAEELGFNGVYQFFRAFNVNELNYRDFYVVMDDKFTSDHLRDLVGMATNDIDEQHDYSIDRWISNSAEETHLNVFLIVVESLSAEYVGYLGNDIGLTPNLDSIASQSLRFDSFFATGTRTVRGLEALSLSIPPTPGRSIVKRPNNSGLFSVASVFNQRGYQSKFIYGGFGYFDNMNAFFSGNGFSIVDRTDLEDEEISFANIWGVADEDLFGRALNEADNSVATNTPFFSLVMTTSNHRPYTYPENRIDIPSGSGRYGAVKYSDYAIGQFIDQARERPWFDDTVFVIVADHTAGSAGKSALPVPAYHIPMMIFSPANILPGRVDKLASQIDLAPTLFALLGFDYRSRFFGTNILTMNVEDERALIANYQHLGLLTNSDLTILSPKRQARFIGKPYSEQPDIAHVSPGDARLNEVVSWYQGADYVFNNGLNRDL
jgi:phosphoglycerol transferase MdoB-like AlkP superfamily enzyme